MNRLPLPAFVGILVTLTASSLACAEEAPAKPARARFPDNVRLGQPYLEVIRKYGQPSRVRSAELVPIAGGKPTPVTLWIYDRPMDRTIEFLLGEGGKILQTTVRTKSLEQYRLEVRP
jgi:hypothetical protein